MFRPAPCCARFAACAPVVCPPPEDEPAHPATATNTHPVSASSALTAIARATTQPLYPASEYELSGGEVQRASRLRRERSERGLRDSGYRRNLPANGGQDEQEMAGASRAGRRGADSSGMRQFWRFRDHGWLGWQRQDDEDR